MAWSGCDATSPSSKSSDIPSANPTSAPKAGQRLLSRLQQRLQRTLPSASLEVQTLLGCPNLRLALINADFDTGPLPAAVMRAVIAEPAYWAFCWGSGLAMAQWLLEQPQRVAGRRVLDFGCGSGVAGIAAAQAGAARVIACDSDADALLASAANAELNGVELELCTTLEAVRSPVDLVLVADVLYDRTNLPLLSALEALGTRLLIADSRIADLSAHGYQATHERTALTVPNLGEFDEYRCVRFFEPIAQEQQRESTYLTAGKDPSG